ncbi:unnamed protein product [Lampetra planeri]
MALRPDNPAWHGGLARCHHHRQFAAPRATMGERSARGMRPHEERGVAALLATAFWSRARTATNIANGRASPLKEAPETRDGVAETPQRRALSLCRALHAGRNYGPPPQGSERGSRGSVGFELGRARERCRREATRRHRNPGSAV